MSLVDRLRAVSDSARGVGERLELHLRRIAEVNPVGRLYGLVRTLIATAGLITLLFNDPAELFVQVSTTSAVNCDAAAAISLYCAVPDLDVARIVAIAILCTVVAGVLPRWTAIPHWWVAFSYQASSATIEGGDQVAAITTLLLVPVALQDSRRNHWSSYTRAPGLHGSLIAHFSLTMIRLQAAIIYLVSGAAKLGEAQWQDGTAMYYWMGHATFGAPEWQQPIFSALFSSAAVVTVVTWGVPILEIAVAMALFAGPGLRRALLFPIAGMHTMIALSMGLVSFAIVMIALDIIYLWPLRSDGKARRAEGPAGVARPTSADRVTRVDV